MGLLPFPPEAHLAKAWPGAIGALLVASALGACTILDAPTVSSPPTTEVRVPTAACVGIPRDVCESAAAEAEAHGLSRKPGQAIESRTVRRTMVEVCDSVTEPMFDVTFVLRDPSAVIVVTVGLRSDGQLAACTY